jgi:iron complex outermembrane receptor protein
MRIKVMVLALAGVAAAWQVRADEADAAVAAEGAAPMEQVVISGDKLKRTEIDSSASVGARNRRQIIESGVTSLDEVASQMANVGTAENLSIRGVSAYGPTGGGGRTITLVVDGVPQDGFGQDIANLSVWDADRVEVLRGPQSTNQGRNSLAGAVVLKTRDPSDVRDFSYRVSAGNQNAHRVALAGGGAIVEQVLAGRISLEQRKRDGDVYNPTRDDKRSNHDDGHTLRGKLRITPWGDRYQALVTLVDDKQQLGYNTVEAVTVPLSARQNLSNEPRDTENHTRSAALEQTFRLGGADITLLTTYSHNRYRRVQDYDGTELNQGYRKGENIDRQWVQEARANFEAALFGHQLKGVAGLYYANQHYAGDDVFTVPVSYVLGLTGQCRVQATCDALYGADFIDRRNMQGDASKTRAAFGEVDYVIDKLTLTAGMRFDGERQRRILETQTSGTSPLARQVFSQLIAGGIFAGDNVQNLGHRQLGMAAQAGRALCIGAGVGGRLDRAARLPHRRRRLQLPARLARLRPGVHQELRSFPQGRIR